jgi:hypothetical protein
LHRRRRKDHHISCTNFPPNSRKLNKILVDTSYSETCSKPKKKKKYIYIYIYMYICAVTTELMQNLVFTTLTYQ